MAAGTTNVGFEEKLWTAADKLRSNMDAAEYKHVVLGLIFLKYVSDSFTEKYEELKAEGYGDEEDRDEYLADNIFWVPKEARWESIKAHATSTDIGTVIDNALELIEKENDSLKGVLTKNYSRPELDKTRLGELVTLFTNIEVGSSAAQEKDVLGRVYEYFLSKFASAEGKLGGEFYTPSCIVRTLVEMIEPFEGQIFDPACGSGGMFCQSARFVKEHQGNIRDISIFGQESNPTTWKLAKMNLAIRGLEANLGKHNADSFHDDQHKTLKANYILANPPYGGNEKTEVKNHFPADLASSETADLFMSVIMYRLKKNGRAAVILPDGFLFGTDNAKVAIKKKLFSEFNLHTVIRMPHSVFAPYTSITTNILFFDHTKPTEETWFYRLDMPEGYKNFSKTKPMELKHFDPAMDWWNNREEINVDGFDKAKKYTAEEIAARNYNIDLCGYTHEEEEILPPKELIQQYQEKRASLNADIDRILAQITEILGIDLEGE